MRRARRIDPKDYLEIRVKQLIEDRKKAHDPYDKEWYLRLISELRYVITVINKNNS